MYTSDYGYAAGNECVTNTDIGNYYSSSRPCRKRFWFKSITTISAYSTNAVEIVVIRNNTIITPKKAVNYLKNIYPVFYLSKDVVITGGTGSLEDPYLVTK